jgi:hypothetical protein
VSTARVRACAALRTVSPCKKKENINPDCKPATLSHSSDQPINPEPSFAVYPTTSPRHLPPFASPNTARVTYYCSRHLGVRTPFFVFSQGRVDSFCSGLRASTNSPRNLRPLASPAIARVTYYCSRHLRVGTPVFCLARGEVIVFAAVFTPPSTQSLSLDASPTTNHHLLLFTSPGSGDPLFLFS